MTIYNNGMIEMTGLIPAEALEKIQELDNARELPFGITRIDKTQDGSASVLVIEEECGYIDDDLNTIVEILKPYGVAPLVGEYNRYYGDYDGYDVFTGERFESMDDVEYGGWLVRDTNGKYDELIRAARELVDYFQFHNKNCTKAQDERVENLKTALAGLGKI